MIEALAMAENPDAPLVPDPTEMVADPRRARLRWYVLRSKPHKESVLARYAKGQGHSIFYPTIPYKPVNYRASRIRAYFPGYLFVRADLQGQGVSTFSWMPFSSGLVHVGGEPAPVPEATVRALAARVSEVWAAGGLQAAALHPGDRVMIRQGMFEGYEGLFDVKLPGSERVRVLLRMLNNRFVPVEVDVGLVERLP
jgi:transcriptional antiterminator RfaH